MKNNWANIFNDETTCLLPSFEDMQWYLAVLDAVKSILYSPIPLKLSSKPSSCIGLFKTFLYKWTFHQWYIKMSMLSWIPPFHDNEEDVSYDVDSLFANIPI